MKEKVIFYFSILALIIAIIMMTKITDYLFHSIEDDTIVGGNNKTLLEQKRQSLLEHSKEFATTRTPFGYQKVAVPNGNSSRIGYADYGKVTE